MEAPTNLYSALVFKLNPRIKQYLDELDAGGQIDHDQNGHPYLVKVDSGGDSNYVVHIVRNGQLVNFIINTRKRSEPIRSWNAEDGYVRPEAEPASVNVQSTQPEGPKRERQRRTTLEDMRLIVDQLLRG